MDDRRREAGAATVVVLALVFALGLIAWGAGSVVELVVAHRDAQNAADLAALAAADPRSSGGCDVAARVAAANRARLVACEVDGATASVEVSVTAIVGHRVEIHGRARAGPR